MPSLQAPAHSSPFSSIYLVLPFNSICDQSQMSQHQLPNLPQPPHVFDKDVSLLREAGQEAGHKVRDIHGLIAASSEQPCCSIVIERVLQAENCAQLVSNAATLYTLVDREGPLGLAAAGITSDLDKLMRGLKEDPVVARCVEAVWNKQQHEQASDVVLDREKAKALLECRRDFSQHTPTNDNSGKIPTEVKDELKVVSSSFLQNLDKVDDCLWFTREELDGLPEDTIRELEDAPGSSPDKIRLPLSDPRSRWMLTKLNCPETRRKLYVGTREVVSNASTTFCCSSRWLMDLTSIRQRKMQGCLREQSAFGTKPLRNWAMPVIPLTGLSQ